MAKFTFKKQPRETGLAAVARPHASVDIKLNGRVCGYIQAPWALGNRKWVVRFSVKTADSDQHPGWKWIGFKNGQFETEDAARTWIKAVDAKIQEKFDLHLFED